MKKVFAIIAILVVLVGAVFADGVTTPSGQTQRITVKTVVERKDPQFLLKGVNGGTAAGFTAEAGIINPATDAGSHDGTILSSTSDISQNDVVASFGLFQTEDAKNRFAYTFNISATSMVQVKNAAGAAVAVADAYTTATAPVFSALGNTNWYASTTDGIAAGTSSLDASTGVTASVTFDGVATIVKDTSNPKLTFTVTWANDRLAPAGDYEADVTMAFTVV